MRESYSSVSLTMICLQAGHVEVSVSESSTPLKRTLCLSVFVSWSGSSVESSDGLDFFLIGPDKGSSFCLCISFLPLKSSLYAHFHSVFGCWESILLQIKWHRNERFRTFSERDRKCFGYYWSVAKNVNIMQKSIIIITLTGIGAHLGLKWKEGVCSGSFAVIY